MLMQNLFRFLERRADGDRDEIVFRHHLADGNVGAGFEAQITIGQDADQLFILGDRNAGNFVAAHDFQRFGN
jgi:hypothetical protein